MKGLVASLPPVLPVPLPWILLLLARPRHPLRTNYLFLRFHQKAWMLFYCNNKTDCTVDCGMLPTEQPCVVIYNYLLVLNSIQIPFPFLCTMFDYMCFVYIKLHFATTKCVPVHFLTKLRFTLTLRLIVIC